METQSDNLTKSWLYRLRYLKMFKNNNSATADAGEISNANEASNITTFRRSIVVANSTSEIIPELRRNENNLRRSLRKWHKRMKNCFSKSSRHLSQRQSISLGHEAASPTFSISNSTNASQKENIYILGSSIQRVPISELSHSPVSEMTPKNEISCLAHHVWYWGPVPKSLVEAKLHGAPDGSFLVRDSASDRHIFSISFRSVGKTLHARIEHTSSGYKLFDHKGFATVKNLIEEAVRISSEEGLFCYTKSRGDEPNFPVRLLNPISRYEEVRSLQSLSRFVIRRHINVNDIDKLCLPPTLIGYLKEENYF